MKKLKVIFDSSPPEFLYDEDDRNITDYSKSLSSLFVSGNIVIMETTSGNLILRPSKLVSIKVEEDIVVKNESKKDENEDIISD